MRACPDQTLIQNTIASWVAYHGPTKYGLNTESTVSMLLNEALSADLLSCSDASAGQNSLVYCKEAKWDSEMLGVRVGRFSLLSSSRDPSKERNLVSRFLDVAKSQFDLLIGRLDSRDVCGLNVLEDAGFRVMDSLVTLVTEPVSGYSDPSVRLYIPSDRPILEEIASKSFREDHYHADPRLSPERCDSLYLQWVRNSCAGRAAAILVCNVDGEPSGFITCQVDSEGKNLRKSGAIDLVAVAPHMQGRGLGRKLVAAALAWFHEQGVGHIEVGTQISNIPAIRLYQRFGFQVFRFVYTVHGWPSIQTSPKEDNSHA